MAGRGPAPKASNARRRTNEPLRGEWVQLEPLDKPVLRDADAEWSQLAIDLWETLRGDPATALLSTGEVGWLWQSFCRWDDLKDAEQRLRLDGLGLTTKGKRDLRYRMPEDGVAAAVAPRARRSRAHLKAV